MTHSRTRIKDNTTSSVLESTGTIKKNNETNHTCESEPVSFALGWSYPTGSYQSMSDYVVPNFARRSAAGEVFNNPMSSFKSERSVSTGTRAYTVPWKGSYSGHKHCADYRDESVPNSAYELSRWSGPVGHLDVPLGTSIQNLINLASTEAAANVDAPTFQSVVAIAELRETLSYLRNPLGALNRELTDINNWKRRKRKLDRKTVGEVISDNWLSYRYAIMPIVNDTRNLAEAVARTVVDSEPVRKTARGSASSNGETQLDGSISLSDYQTRTATTVEVRTGILYEMTLSPNTFGLGTEQIPVALWEAIPLSFMVDWVFNIGSFIEAMTPVAGVRRLATWTSVKTDSTTTRETWWARGGTHSYGTDRVITADGRCSESYVTTSRTRNPGIQVGLAHKVSPLQGDLGKKRLLDLLAIGHQLLVSK